MTTSEQARCDAMKDAETLRPFLFGIAFHPLLSETYVLRPLRVAAKPYGVGRLRIYKTEDAVRRARNAAHAAFLAVPGLRG